MPFRESRVEASVALMKDYDTGVFTVRELCTRHGVSHDTFYRLKRRREAGDERWFECQSRAPLTSPHVTPPDVVAEIVKLREKFPYFGPKKLRARLASDEPGLSVPAASTIGDILKREGLTRSRSRRRPVLEQGTIEAGSAEPNGEWAYDFKGWFRVLDGTRCDPLTISDTASRYLLEVRITEPTYQGVKTIMERVFSEIGLPDALRSDNGAPFGSTGAGGLSKLSVWLLKLGRQLRRDAVR